MQSTESNRKPIPWYWWTLAGLILLVAYPLSLGPVGWALEWSRVDGDSLIATVFYSFYSPLVQLYQYAPGVRDIYMPYYEWWSY
ncbi:MAG: hypothetical protein JWN70_3421 [Planctomycetaceae bacterium]|nr:hypothetical protein [Planctomycetaceae bacterium]